MVFRTLPDFKAPTCDIGFTVGLYADSSAGLVLETDEIEV